MKSVFDETAAELDFDAAVTERIKKLGADAFSTPEKKKKQVSSLLRYGFSMDEINRALKTLRVDAADDYED